MKFSLKIISIFFLFFGISSANENIRFVDINYIVNNSTSGKKLNQVIESKNKKIISELNNLGKKLKEKKDKIVKQKNILKKDELEKLVKNYAKMTLYSKKQIKIWQIVVLYYNLFYLRIKKNHKIKSLHYQDLHYVN